MSLDDPYLDSEVSVAQRRVPGLRAEGLRRRRLGRLRLGAGAALAVLAALVASLTLRTGTPGTRVQTVGPSPSTSASSTTAVDHPSGRREPAGPTPAVGLRQPPSPARAVIGGLRSMPSLYLATTGTYVSEQTTAPGRPGAAGKLFRINPYSGQVLATLELPGVSSAARLVGRSLWVLAVTEGKTGPFRSTLLEVDPTTLIVHRRLTLDSDKFNGDTSLVAAGGWLWVGGGGALSRVSLSTARVTATVRVEAAATTKLGTDATGTVLIDGESTQEGIQRVQSRNPVTGALVNQTAAKIGVTSPSIGGVIDGGVWVSAASGMAGYAQRLDLPALKTQPSTLVEGSNGVQANVVGSILWVTQGAGGTFRNYCANPDSGAVIDRLREGVGANDVILGFGLGSVFYVNQLHDGIIYRAPIPQECTPQA